MEYNYIILRYLRLYNYLFFRRRRARLNSFDFQLFNDDYLEYYACYKLHHTFVFYHMRLKCKYVLNSSLYKISFNRLFTKYAICSI